MSDPLYEAARHRGPVVALRVKGTRRELAAPARRATIGSRAGCDILIDDACVSGVHCVLERNGAALYVRDKGSKNGTYVNGHAVEGAELRPGSVLTIGRTQLVALAEGGRGVPTAYEQLRGADPRFRAAIDTAIRAATTDCSILIVGETGTGKELVARAVHEASHRSSGPFVAINCGAIPRELIGSELFGHEKGSFTGAVVDRDGCFLQADNGTLLLDELGELPLEQQPHLLRVLETRRVRRVGGAIERQVDVRVIAATNRIDGLGTPQSAIRLDLYHRLATVVVHLPPLRERMKDVDEIAESILDDLAPEHGRRWLSKVARDAIRTYEWPGNVRELRSALVRAVALGGDELRLDDLFPQLAPPMLKTVKSSRPASSRDLAPIEVAQRDLMADALSRCSSIRAAAAYVGMPKSTFAEKALRWGLITRKE
ncbi:MAG TPA: sigma 54-interacting transcriptional regulator [Kofleriaceae bacterium]|nr:sigma 54-interacting transcriptional regulator [Kofleriaceae bacterium]